ncbi:TPA: hypothetical protein ACGH7Z_004245 [Shigella flexneri]
MFNIILGVAAVGVGLYILNELDDRAGEEKKRWENQRESVCKSIEEHNRYIEQHVEYVQSMYDFHQLVDLHYSCMKVANEAYKLLNDAKKSMGAIYDAINKLKAHRSKLFNDKKESDDYEKKKEIQAEINMIKEIIDGLYSELDLIKKDKEHFYQELKAFNLKTSSIKYRIRDNTGYKGFDWYNRLQERTLLRR